MRAHGSIHPAWWLGTALTALALASVAVPVQSTRYRIPVALAFLVAALIAGALPLALVRPGAAVVALAVGTAGTAVLSAADRDPAVPWPLPVTTMIAFTLLVALLAYRRGWPLALLAWGAGTLAAVGGGTLGGLWAGLVSPPGVLADLIVAVACAAAAGAMGVLLAGRQTARAELVREKAVSASEQSRRLVVEERSRIARELHDVVAHSMSLVQVQASTARYRLEGVDERAAAEFDDIAASARDALGEMRRLLGALRTEGDAAERMPQRTVPEMPALVESVRRAGVEVDLGIDDAARAAPPSVQVVAFRVVQEALSNAVRHSPGSRITVRITVPRDGTLAVAVANTAPSSAPAETQGGGHGLVGMRERTALLGGTLAAHALPDGGWTVHAELPSDGRAAPAQGGAP